MSSLETFEYSDQDVLTMTEVYKREIKGFVDAIEQEIQACRAMERELGPKFNDEFFNKLAELKLKYKEVATMNELGDFAKLEAKREEVKEEALDLLRFLSLEKARLQSNVVKEKFN